MQIWKILGGGKESRKWDKKEFMKFPEDCENKSLLNVILDHLQNLDDVGHYSHWIVFSEKEELALENLGKIFLAGTDIKALLLIMICSVLRERRQDAPVVQYLIENLNPSLGGPSRNMLTLRFKREE